jgi:hypothetical protein
MYFADIASSLYFGLENCAGWRARSIMAENGAEGNVENGADLSFPSLLVVIEVYETVAVVDLDVEEAKQREPQSAGNLCAEVIADARQIEGEHFLVFLAQVSKLENRLIRPVNIFHTPA